MDISKFLSKVMGLYLIIVSVAMLVNMHQFLAYTTNLINDAPLIFVTSFFTIIVGLLLVVSHNIWEWNWRVIITVLAWLTLLKGVTLLISPHLIDKGTLEFVKNVYVVYATVGFDFVLGVLLCYFGFRR